MLKAEMCLDDVHYLPPIYADITQYEYEIVRSRIEQRWNAFGNYGTLGRERTKAILTKMREGAERVLCKQITTIEFEVMLQLDFRGDGIRGIDYQGGYVRQYLLGLKSMRFETMMDCLTLAWEGRWLDVPMPSESLSTLSLSSVPDFEVMEIFLEIRREKTAFSVVKSWKSRGRDFYKLTEAEIAADIFANQAKFDFEDVERWARISAGNPTGKATSLLVEMRKHFAFRNEFFSIIGDHLRRDGKQSRNKWARNSNAHLDPQRWIRMVSSPEIEVDPRTGKTRGGPSYLVFDRELQFILAAVRRKLPRGTKGAGSHT